MANYRDGVPMTQTRRDYILAMLERNLNGGTWIRISERELQDFGGAFFFAGCKITRADDTWFTTKSKSGYSLDHERNRTQIQLPWKIQAPSGGWRPGFTPPTVAFTTSATTSTQCYMTIEPTTEGKKHMEHHHINRDQLITVVSANKEAYDEALTTYRDLYGGALHIQSERHIRGEIPQNQIAVRDKDGGVMHMLTDMSQTFEAQLRELELDDREVVVLNHEEYGQYVLGAATNLKSLEDGITRLEELP